MYLVFMCTAFSREVIMKNGLSREQQENEFDNLIITKSSNR